MRRFTPRRAARKISEWQTLLPSPTYASLNPRKSPNFSSSVKKSASAWHGMKAIGERVDHRDVGVGGHFFQHALFVDARDDAVYPALKVARHVRDRFALAEPRLRMVEKTTEPPML